jgi:hypothetical protein
VTLGGPQRSRDHLEPSAAYLLAQPDARAAPAVGGGDERNKLWTQLLTCDFVPIPAVIATNSAIEIELDHALRQGGPIRMLVEDSGGHDPNAGELHLPSVQETEDVNELGIRWKMVTVQPDRAPYPVITILAKRAFDLNVDIPEATGKIND